MTLTTTQIMAEFQIRRCIEDEIGSGAKWDDIAIVLRRNLGRAEFAAREERRAAVRRAGQGGHDAARMDRFAPGWPTPETVPQLAGRRRPDAGPTAA